MKKLLTLYSLFIILYSALITPASAITIQNPIKYGTIPEVIDAIITFLMIISFPLLTGAVIYGGFIVITAAGDPAKFNKGWQTIVYAVLGFVIVLLAKGIVMAIGNFFR
ncbi:MAG: hypothetical protein AB1721_01930 [Patescibacteria group bacterium]